ncbi:Rab family, other [Strigomonas culicis]|uniref:Rab family, other n=1 Tax=Strigomonas culicis TaxID=28005 RepID=S9UG82_9TRYP|nr:Rab family, other [Strigomonas culicis]EPY29094.1 Rab family, other [Strigomonas culicis]EPY35064.1 Rab family, other [Strigomonas culicis]EPY37276.1 Rab family, other [Strigomonas culicis]|eukprot:EPY27943.1 Rab family, other [Strigomonas culicis]
MKDTYQHLFKLIIVGDSGTGKSALLQRFTKDTFSEDQSQTVGVEFGAKILDLGDQRIKMQIWDTAGQERYKSVTKSYYRGATGCIIVYDLTNRASYENVARWLADVRELAGEQVVIMLVGNKKDLVRTPGSRVVEHNEASLFAQKNNLLHFETSAASGEFVSDAFLKVARSAVTKINNELGENESTVHLDDEEQNICSQCAC